MFTIQTTYGYYPTNTWGFAANCLHLEEAIEKCKAWGDDYRVVGENGIVIYPAPRATLIDAMTGLPFDFAEFIRDKITVTYWDSINEQWGREAIGL